MTPIREICWCVLAVAATVAVANAQAPRATIEGDITDQSGAAVPDVTITILNTSTGVVTTTKTDSAGHFYVPYLNPGVIYRVSGEKEGFQRVVAESVRTAVNEVTRVNLTLSVGQLSEEVTVSAGAPLLTTANATLGGVVDNQKVQELPLKGRNPYALMALVPGVRPSAGLNDLPVDQIGTAFASINGARGNQNEYLLDGAPNSAPAQNQPVVFPSADAVQQIKVDTSGYSAEFGRAGGGVINVVTRSGGSQFHTDMYEFFRNDKLDGKNFFAKLGDLKPAYRFNQFGASSGGPVILPKMYDGRRHGTFFFMNYEGARVVQGVTYTATVPTALQREGDFSQTFNSRGQLIRIFDPRTTRRDPSNTQRFIRDPFPGNRIDHIDPVAMQLLQFVPLPNTPGDPVTGVNNFVSAQSQFIQKDTGMLRIDHTISSSQKIFGRFNWDDTPQTRADVFSNVGSPSFGPQTFNRRGLIFDHVVTMTPTLILNWHYSFSRLANVRTPRSFGFDIASVGFPGNLAAQVGQPSLPAINVSGMGGSFSIPNQGTGALLGGNDFIRFGMDTHAWQGAVTKVKGRHTIKSGGEFRLIRFNTTQHGDTANNFSFGTSFTQGPDPIVGSQSAGFGFASFLLGTGSGAIQIVPNLALRQRYSGLFLSDNIRATRRLTLNVGVRYDYESPRTDRFNQLTNFNPNAQLPLEAPGLTLKGGLTFVGVNGSPRGQWNPERNNVSPRVDFAWEVLPRTVVRGGFGVFYGATTGVGADAGTFGVSGFVADTSFVGSLDGVTPLRFLNNPYPDGVNQPTGSGLGVKTLLGQSIQFVDRNQHTPYAEAWNFSVQRELPGQTLFQMAYTGSRGIHLFGPMELNQLPDDALKLGTRLQALVDNPFAGQITTGPLSSAKVSYGQLLRPFPQFTSVSQVNSTRGASTYHALQVLGEKRMGHGVSLTAAYTFSKLIDDVNSGFAGEALSGGGGVQDFNNLRAERSISNIDQPHRFVASYIWQLPVGPGKRFLASHGRVIGKIVGEWHVGGLLTLASGPPLGVTCATNTTQSQGGGCRPNLVGDPALDPDARTIEHFFNTNAFAQPDPFTFGNAGRFLPSLRGDATKNA